MPHTYAHDDDEQEVERGEAQSVMPSAGVVVGGAIAAYLLYKVMR